jgi:hypothetical protein
MNKILVSVLALLTMATLTAPVFADSPHFISGTSGLSGASLTCSFKEAGLGNLGVTSISITCSANATAVYECVNGGSKHPMAANKETVTAPVSGSGIFPVRNGQTTGTLTVVSSPPGPGSFTCPSGQTLVLFSVIYTNVVVSGAGASLSLADQTFTNQNAPTP